MRAMRIPAGVDEGIALREPQADPPPAAWDVRPGDGGPYAEERCRACGRMAVIMGLREFHEEFAMDRTCRPCRKRRKRRSDPLPLMIVAAAIAAL